MPVNVFKAHLLLLQGSLLVLHISGLQANKKLDFCHSASGLHIREAKNDQRFDRFSFKVAVLCLFKRFEKLFIFYLIFLDILKIVRLLF